MKISLEISLYPLKENYVEIIKKFIEGLKSDKDLSVVVNSMSTRIIGESSVIFNLLDKEMEKVFDEARASFVIKIIKAAE